ncbi:acid protease [Lenzites betulinus]|nr:acid protease [Lenzites betulinus]
MIMLARAALFLSAVALSSGLPNTVPLQLDEVRNFSVGAQNFSLVIDTGSFALLVKQGLYLPGPSSQQTNLSEFIQFNGASEDSVAPAQETVFFVRDDVQFAGVTLHKFFAGNITTGDDLPADGVAGFSPPASDNDDMSQGQGVVETFCEEGTLAPCQFGLSLLKDGTGSMNFGELDISKVSGNVTTVPTMPNDSWTVVNATAETAPVLFIDDKPFSSILATFDSGTTNIIGSLTHVRAILKQVGYNITEQTNKDNVTVAIGTYDCARTPARFGFSFPPSETVHYIDLAANVLNRTADGRICTANILGTSTVDAPQWSIGQTWFQGRYVQHDLGNKTLSFADLK